MANLPETASYDAGVYQLETTDPVIGGADGVDNAGARNLANRTAYLKAHVDLLETIVSQADAEAGVSTTLKGWTALRVKQAITALHSLGSLINVQLFTSGTATYTPTAGTNKIVVEVIGGGGAGSGAATTTTTYSSGGGGGSGAYAKKTLTSGFSGATVTVGAGGVPVSGLGGGNGSTSSFGSLVTATGGYGGAKGGPATVTFLAQGGGGAVLPTSGDINAGGAAATCGWSNYTDAYVLGGTGGSTIFGGGGFGSANAIGGNGIAPGAGGGGSSNITSKSASSGGAGAAGIVIVWEYV
jgi:hypothetical protein